MTCVKLLCIFAAIPGFLLVQALNLQPDHAANPVPCQHENRETETSHVQCTWTCPQGNNHQCPGILVRLVDRCEDCNAGGLDPRYLHPCIRKPHKCSC
ncbi:hypothetical protein PGT21_025788 [Puccinia graminis f. sp. tritici]|uniref:Uncharacterized protein n=1 Tax=Puccinia graminis f. sp. tritici TaxID=56615 RepID=A0A5B0QBJ1_PUCGR|nr:hypothetical protein PGT21_025788 [Puccinia graminis f. sp. tritici]